MELKCFYFTLLLYQISVSNCFCMTDLNLEINKNQFHQPWEVLLVPTVAEKCVYYRSYNMTGTGETKTLWVYHFDVMSVKWCAVKQKGHSEALWCGSSYPRGIIGGTGFATWGPRCLVGSLIHTCQKKRCTSQSACHHYSEPSSLTQTKWRETQWQRQ